jgi:hypothetical protein
MKQTEWTETLVHLLSLALRLEGEGLVADGKARRVRHRLHQTAGQLFCVARIDSPTANRAADEAMIS